jgi:outer membrane protein OmpA-like peptidoglycan-associated protein
MYIIFSLILQPVSLFANQEPMPGLSGRGFQNLNDRAEYNYEKYPKEVIWTEFGRPYWNTSGVLTKTKTSPQSDSHALADSDEDGIFDKDDHCPKSAANVLVNKFGCELDENENLTLDVKFKSGKDVLDPRYTEKLDNLAEVLKKNKDISIQIQGHTDATGNRASNILLSHSRSKNVVDYLVKTHGIIPQRLQAKGFGPDLPIADNSSRNGRRLNRRVEVKILKN